MKDETVEDKREDPWLPDPIPADSFGDGDGWANINRSPHDCVSGVVYKRAAAIKRVLYELEEAPVTANAPQTADAPVTASAPQTTGSSGRGQAIIQWLFSEAPGTEEGLMSGRGFRYLQDVTLSPGADTGQRSHPGLDTIIYVVAGRGALNHRPTAGSPILVRPLGPGDAALIAGSELYSLENADATAPLRMILLGLATRG